MPVPAPSSWMHRSFAQDGDEQTIYVGSLRRSYCIVCDFGGPTGTYIYADDGPPDKKGRPTIKKHPVPNLPDNPGYGMGVIVSGTNVKIRLEASNGQRMTYWADQPQVSPFDCDLPGVSPITVNLGPPVLLNGGGVRNRVYRVTGRTAPTGCYLVGKGLPPKGIPIPTRTAAVDVQAPTVSIRSGNVTAMELCWRDVTDNP